MEENIPLVGQGPRPYVPEFILPLGIIRQLKLFSPPLLSQLLQPLIPIDPQSIMFTTLNRLSPGPHQFRQERVMCQQVKMQQLIRNLLVLRNTDPFVIVVKSLQLVYCVLERKPLFVVVLDPLALPCFIYYFISFSILLHRSM